MSVIQFQDVTLDFPVKGGAPTYLKEQVTGRFRKDGRRSRSEPSTGQPRVERGESSASSDRTEPGNRPFCA